MRGLAVVVRLVASSGHGCAWRKSGCEGNTRALHPDSVEVGTDWRLSRLREELYVRR